MNEEDVLILSSNCVRWDDNYQLRTEEVDVFVEPLNSCSNKLGRRILFLKSAVATAARPFLDSWDWYSEPHHPNEQDALVRLGGFSARLELADLSAATGHEG